MFILHTYTSKQQRRLLPVKRIINLYLVIRNFRYWLNTRDKKAKGDGNPDDQENNKGDEQEGQGHNVPFSVS